MRISLVFEFTLYAFCSPLKMYVVKLRGLLFQPYRLLQIPVLKL